MWCLLRRHWNQPELHCWLGLAARVGSDRLFRVQMSRSFVIFFARGSSCLQRCRSLYALDLCAGYHGHIQMAQGWELRCLWTLPICTRYAAAEVDHWPLRLQLIRNCSWLPNSHDSLERALHVPVMILLCISGTKVSLHPYVTFSPSLLEALLGFTLMSENAKAC